MVTDERVRLLEAEAYGREDAGCRGRWDECPDGNEVSDFLVRQGSQGDPRQSLGAGRHE